MARALTTGKFRSRKALVNNVEKRFKKTGNIAATAKAFEISTVACKKILDDLGLSTKAKPKAKAKVKAKKPTKSSTPKPKAKKVAKVKKKQPALKKKAA